jgi:hypothetical protein
MKYLSSPYNFLIRTVNGHSGASRARSYLIIIGGMECLKKALRKLIYLQYVNVHRTLQFLNYAGR